MQFGKQIGKLKEELGKLVEEIITRFLIEHGARILRPDYLLEEGRKLLFLEGVGDGELLFLEAKVLSRYLPSGRHSLEGHGLSLYQVKKYMLYYKKHNIKCFFLVVEPDTGCVWGEYLHKLEKLSNDKKHKTEKQNIIIYSLEGFRRQYEMEEWLKKTGYMKEIQLKFIFSEIERLSKEDSGDFIKNALDFLKKYEKENRLKFLKK